MIRKKTSRLSAPGYALYSKAAKKTRKTGEESTLKNTGSCVDNPGHYTMTIREDSKFFDVKIDEINDRAWCGFDCR